MTVNEMIVFFVHSRHFNALDQGWDRLSKSSGQVALAPSQIRRPEPKGPEGEDGGVAVGQDGEVEVNGAQAQGIKGLVVVGRESDVPILKEEV